MRPRPLFLVLSAIAGLTTAAVPTSTTSTTVRARRDECTTAIALRDKVPAEQMIGTMLFTRPWLAAAYDEHVYIEATEFDSGRRALLAALADAHAEDCTVDLFFLAHGDDFVGWLERTLPLPRLRLVYDTGAGDAAQGPRWLELGAQSFVGHPGANLAPIFYAYFLPAWVSGKSVEEAVIESNAKTFVTIDSARPYLGDQAGPLWRGTKAQWFGEGNVTRE